MLLSSDELQAYELLRQYSLELDEKLAMFKKSAELQAAVAPFITFVELAQLENPDFIKASELAAFFDHALLGYLTSNKIYLQSENGRLDDTEPHGVTDADQPTSTLFPDTSLDEVAREEPAGQSEDKSVSGKERSALLTPLPYKDNVAFSTKSFCNEVSYFACQCLAIVAQLQVVRQGQIVRIFKANKLPDKYTSDLPTVLSSLYSKGYVHCYEQENGSHDDLLYTLSYLGKQAFLREKSRNHIKKNLRLLEHRFLPKDTLFDFDVLSADDAACAALRAEWLACVYEKDVNWPKYKLIGLTSIEYSPPDTEEPVIVRTLAQNVAVDEIHEGNTVFLSADPHYLETLLSLDRPEGASVACAVLEDGTFRFLNGALAPAWVGWPLSDVEADATENGGEIQQPPASEENPLEPSVESAEAEEKESTHEHDKESREGVTKEEAAPSSVYTQRMAIDTALEMAEKDSLDCTLLFLNAESHAAQHNLRPMYRRFAFAFADPAAKDLPCTAATLSELFDSEPLEGEELCFPYVYACALLRLFSCPEDVREHELKNRFMQIQDDKSSSLWDELPELKNTLKLWQDFTANIGQGFTEKIAAHIREHSENASQLQQYSKEAGQMCEMAQSFLRKKFDHSKVRQLVEVLFGPESDFQTYLAAAATNQQDQREEAQLFTVDYLKKDQILSAPFSSDDLDDRVLDEKLNSTWSTVEGNNSRKRHDPFKGSYRNSTVAKMKEFVLAIANWAYADSPGMEKDTDKRQFIQTSAAKLTRSLNTLQDNVRELVPHSSVGAHCLDRTILPMLSLLSGNVSAAPPLYVNLLRSSSVELDENHQPDWNERLEEIFGGADKSDSDDYGSALLIQEHLLKTETTYTGGRNLDADIDKCREHMASSLSDMLTQYTGKIEMAQHYGQITSIESGKILQTVNRRAEQSRQNGNYDFLRRLMERYNEFIQQKTRQIIPSLMSQYEALVEKAGGSSLPIFGEIMRMRDKNKLTVMEEYLSLSGRGNTEVPRVGMFAEDNHFDIFLHRYDKLHSTRSHNRPLIEVYRGLASTYGIKQNRNSRRGERMVQSWSSGGKPTVEQVNTILSELNFDVDDIQLIPEKIIRNSALLHSTFTVRHQDDYAHPIADFGSRLASEGIRILCLYRQLTHNEILDCISKLRGRHTTIILLDGNFALGERRQLAKKIKEQVTAQQKVFLLIDHVLLMYLALLDSAERKNALLQCALPFSYCQPYSSIGAKPHLKCSLAARKSWPSCCFLPMGMWLN